MRERSGTNYWLAYSWHWRSGQGNCGAVLFLEGFWGSAMCELGCWECADRDLFVVVVQLYRTHIYPADCELADLHVFLSFVHLRTATDTGKNSLWDSTGPYYDSLYCHVCHLSVWSNSACWHNFVHSWTHIARFIHPCLFTIPSTFPEALGGWLTFRKRKRCAAYTLNALTWAVGLLHMKGCWSAAGFKAVVHSRRRQWVITFLSLGWSLWATYLQGGDISH